MSNLSLMDAIRCDSSSSSLQMLLKDESQLTAAVNDRAASTAIPVAVTPLSASYDSASAHATSNSSSFSSHFQHREVSPSTRRVVDALLSSVRDMPTAYDAVRVRFIEVYEKLVSCPP